MTTFSPGMLTSADYALVDNILHPREWGIHAEPDLVIAPDGNPYIYRWHLIRQKECCSYLHIQVASDPERPLHDHPWDNMSVILSGGYDELYDETPHLRRYDTHVFGCDMTLTRELRKGDTVYRKATTAHRLILPSHIPYTISLFSTGPEIRKWGFWFPDGWRDAWEVTKLDPETRISIHTGKKT